MPPGLPGALFVAVALTMPTTCFVLARRMDRRPGRPGFWWRVGALQSATCLAVLALLANPSPATSSANSAPAAAINAEPTPVEGRDETRGYQAGEALATDRHHRGSPPPKPEALTAISRLHGRGESPAFAEGFRRGYLAGLAETRRP